MEVLEVLAAILPRIAPIIRKMETSHWKWALIALVCWTVFIGVVSLPFWCSAMVMTLDTSEPTAVVGYLVKLIVLTLAVLALPAWFAFGLAFALFGLETQRFTDRAPKPKRFPDFSPMPEGFADFEQMLEEAKEKSGTLICYDCGHYNAVGQSQCEECGAWVPQTAKARWAYGPRTDES